VNDDRNGVWESDLEWVTEGDDHPVVDSTTPSRGGV
jgi:hypothetical protein